MKKIVLTMGMHRSGTSLMAGILHQSGISMGTPESFIPKPSIENKKGFFENYEFRKINDAILESNGYRVKEWSSVLGDIELNLSVKRKMHGTLERYLNRYETWGWKDPRQMLTSMAWFDAMKELDVLECVKVVYIYRNPYSVARSMMERKNTTSVHHGSRVWELYNRKGLNSLNMMRLPTVFLSLERLCGDARHVLGKVSEFLGETIGGDVFREIYSEELIRSEMKKGNKEEIIEKDVQRLYETLEERHV